MRKRILALLFTLLIMISLCACGRDEVVLQNGMSSDDDKIVATRNIDGTLTLTWSGAAAMQAAEYFNGESAYMYIEMPLANNKEKYVIEAFYYQDTGYAYHIYDVTESYEEVFNQQVENTATRDELPNLVFTEDSLQFTFEAEEYRSLPVNNITYIQLTVAKDYDDEVNRVTSGQYQLYDLITK